jgi:hypothetical protein
MLSNFSRFFLLLYLKIVYITRIMIQFCCHVTGTRDRLMNMFSSSNRTFLTLQRLLNVVRHLTYILINNMKLSSNHQFFESLVKPRSLSLINHLIKLNFFLSNKMCLFFSKVFMFSFTCYYNLFENNRHLHKQNEWF